MHFCKVKGLASKKLKMWSTISAGSITDRLASLHKLSVAAKIASISAGSPLCQHYVRKLTFCINRCMEPRDLVDISSVFPMFSRLRCLLQTPTWLDNH